MPLPSLDSVNYTLALLTLAGIPLAVWRSKSRRRISAAADAILGSEPVLDADHKEMRPGRPGLVHRVSQVEEAVVEFRHLVGIVTEAMGRIDSLDTRIAALENTHVKDIIQMAERAATAAASAEMLRLVNERDTVTGQADEPKGEL
jgi:hypothetical protein